MAVTVRLDDQELELVTFVGMKRHSGAMSGGYHSAIDYNYTASTDVHAAAAEMIVAKAVNSFWNSLHSSFSEGLPDLLDGSEVKWTAKHSNNLVINPTKDGGKPTQNTWYYLVQGELPELTIWGRVWGRKALSDKYFGDKRLRKKAWLVPKEDMYPFTVEDIVCPEFMHIVEESGGR